MTAAKAQGGANPRRPRPSGTRTRPPAATAREAEASGDFVVVEQCGLKLRIPISNVPIDAIEAARAGDNWGATKALLGEEQWNALRAAGGGSRDIDELGKKLTEATGGN